MNLCNEAEIKALLARHGFSFSKALGQNFLINPAIPARIAAECGADRQSAVLEIGPGIGCLTKELSAVAGFVVAVELDRRLPALLKESLAGLDNIELVTGDILKLDLAALTGERFAGLRPMVCANLPYNITSPVLTLLAESKRFDRVTVMLQREVARRIAARAGTPDYGAFSVFMGWHYETEILFDVPPESFLPRPRVWSSVIALDKRTRPPADVPDEPFFFKVVRAAFAQRRKTLVNSLSASLGPGYSREAVSAAVAACGFGPTVRGEELDIPAFAALSHALAV